MVKRFFMKFYLVLIIAFLYIPIAVLVVLLLANFVPEIRQKQLKKAAM